MDGPSVGVMCLDSPSNSELAWSGRVVFNSDGWTAVTVHRFLSVPTFASGGRAWEVLYVSP